MKAKITRLLPGVELPRYQTKESAAFDIAAAETVTLKSGEIRKVRTGLIIQAPKGYYLFIAARGSLGLKKGLMLGNSVGILDRDFAGPQDEMQIILYNISKKKVTVEKGERIAQGLFKKYYQVDWVESKPRSKSRGGFGSTGGYKK